MMINEQNDPTTDGFAAVSPERVFSVGSGDIT